MALCWTGDKILARSTMRLTNIYIYICIYIYIYIYMPHHASLSLCQILYAKMYFWYGCSIRFVLFWSYSGQNGRAQTILLKRLCIPIIWNTTKPILMMTIPRIRQHGDTTILLFWLLPIQYIMIMQILWPDINITIKIDPLENIQYLVATHCSAGYHCKKYSHF